MAFRADLDQIGVTLITLSMGALIASAVVQHQILRSMRKTYPDKDRHRLARFQHTFVWRVTRDPQIRRNYVFAGLMFALGFAGVATAVFRLHSNQHDFGFAVLCAASSCWTIAYLVFNAWRHPLTTSS